MATNNHRKSYKRKWISACRSVTKYNNNSKRHCIDFEKQSPPIAFSSPITVHVDDDDNDSLTVDQSLIEETIDIDEICTNAPAHHSVSGTDSISDNSCLSDDSDQLENCSLKDELVTWVNNFQVKHNAVDGLLKLLKQSGHSELPSTARSLLATPRLVSIDHKSEMEYIYFPLENALLENFQSYPDSVKDSVDTLEISLNIDGIPLFKSSKSSLWPVLCGIMNLTPVRIFPIALTYGKSKPKNLDFLHDTVRDLNVVLNQGLSCGSKVLKVSLRCVVCDAPAKAFVKGTKLYSGYYGCDKCCQRGLWIGRLTYPEVENLLLRTDIDNSFRMQTNEEHHNSDSPFCDLDIDMIKSFPLDYMHQLCLGVVKKMILAWMRGKKEIRISARQVEEISTKLVALRSYIPQCFARKPRSLAEIDRWKATELRQFLLYSGKLVLKGILPHSLYDHFMMLSVASSILTCPQLSQAHLGYAADLLKYFVEKASFLYGAEFIVYNVHCLIHLADEVRNFGSLDMCSGFPFENYLQKLKRLVRSGKNPLAQIVKRLHELDGSDFDKAPKSSVISLKAPNNAYCFS